MRLIAFVSIGVTLASLALAAGSGRIVSANGVRVVVPPRWQRVPAASASALIDPRTVLVVGTAGVEPRRSQCQIAAYSLPPRAAVVVIVGWTKLALSGAPSTRPGRWPLESLTAVRRRNFECFVGRGRAATLVLDGKAYQVNVLVGDRASRQRVTEALTVARSFDLVR